jgi:hypothetical protein
MYTSISIFLKGIFMKKLFLFLIPFLFLFAPVVRADTMVAQSPDGSIIITAFQDKCTNKKIKAQLSQMGYEDTYKATVSYQGKLLQACYVPLTDEGIIGLVDENGDSAGIPMSAFKRSPSI